MWHRLHHEQQPTRRHADRVGYAIDASVQGLGDNLIGLAVDSSGNVYVADQNHNRAVKLVRS
ncbi:hypothetical protein [Mycobacterium sp.]|uniref:hypothetical protein n=1 Tax=Mycobacterium sp. TaxID=1785 RepID=UPI003C70A410